VGHIFQNLEINFLAQGGLFLRFGNHVCHFSSQKIIPPIRMRFSIELKDGTDKT
jgi:hypothetical protein